MSQPLLDLDQEWHRQRAQLRANHLRPPPLVTAGLDLAYDETSASHHRVQVAGMALIFGLFPVTVRDFIQLARTRMRLGDQSQRSELEGVLNTRIQALWAWMPTLRQDCYLELDHATDEAHMWLTGPEQGQGREVSIADEEEQLNEAFLSAFIITSSRHWGGQEGLTKLVERFGRRSLLVAAQVAEALERDPNHLNQALEYAQSHWPRLQADVEAVWEPLADDEDPWVCVQLGRLALRLGLVRAARLLLNRALDTEVSHVAFYDLGQACEALDDLIGAEAAFMRYAGIQAEDPDGWRHLLFCRLRLGLLNEADEALRKFHEADGEDREIVERLLNLLTHARVHPQHRAYLVGWLSARLKDALSKRLPLTELIGGIIRTRFNDHPSKAGQAFLHQVERLRQMLFLQIAAGQLTEFEIESASPAHLHAIDALIRIVLLCLPFVGSFHDSQDADEEAALTLQACDIWAQHELFGEGTLDKERLEPCLIELAQLALDR